MKSEFDKRPPIWLLWIMSTSGITSLRAICTTQGLANRYRKAASEHEDVIRAWVEERIANHLYGEGDLEQNYGDKALARYLADELESRQVNNA